MIDNDDIAKINERNECKKYIWQSASIFFFGKIFQVAVSLIFFEYLWKSTKIILIIIKIDQSLCIANSYIWSIYRLIFNDKGKDFRFFLFTYLFFLFFLSPVVLLLCILLFAIRFIFLSWLIIIIIFFNLWRCRSIYKQMLFKIISHHQDLIERISCFFQVVINN